MKCLLTIFLFFSLSVKAQFFGATGTTAAKDSMYVAFDTSNVSLPSPYQAFRGDYKYGNKVLVSPSGLITATVVSANYLSFSGAGCFPNNGYTTGTSGLAPSAVMNELWFQGAATYSAANPQLIWSGLNTAKTYVVKSSASFGPGSPTTGNSTDFHVVGLTTPAVQTISNTFENTSSLVLFTIQPASDGTIKFYWNTTSGSSISGCTFATVAEQ